MAELRNISHLKDEGIPSNNMAANHDDVMNSKQHQSYDNKGFLDDGGHAKIFHITGNDSQDRKGEDNQNGDEDDDDDETGCSRKVGEIQRVLADFLDTHRKTLWTLFYIVLLLAYFTYFAYAMYYRFGDEGSWRLMVITVLATLGLAFNMALNYRKRKRADNLDTGDGESCLALQKVIAKIRLNILLPVLLVIGFIVYVVLEIAIDKPRNLISLAGLTFFILVFYIFSFSPSKVKWRPVFWGIALQLIFALLILRTAWGYDAFNWMGERVTEFLSYTDAGSKFIFGEKYEDHYFAFKVLPVVVFFSTFVSMLYYLGVMQVVIKQVGRFLSFCLNTSPAESVNAAGNIFIGQTEAPLLIRPFLENMTNSEIHAVMTGGFATIAGAVMAAYILYEVPANHLLSASVMSAPAALAMAKLFYPETEKSKHNAKDVYNLAKGSERNLIEAASNGASMSISLVANIAVNLIAFVALLDFVNATLVWLGDRVGYDGLTFQLICSYIFWPLAFLMGVDTEDCRTVAELIGTKTFLNEFVAYVDLSVYIKNQKALDRYLSAATTNVTHNLTGNWMYMGSDIFLNDTGAILKKGLISDRSVVIATYALCGFSNLASMGVQLGALGAMAPSRKGDLSNIVFRAMIAGNVACFMTACIAGLFYEKDI